MSDAIDGVLTYDPTWKALICLYSSCHYAVQRTTIHRHLQNTHHVSAAIQLAAKQYVASLPEVRVPTQLPSMPHGGSPHPHLRIYSVFQCRHCSSITRNRKTMKVHGNQQHQLHNVKDAGRFTVAKAQSWTAGKHQRYWTVNMRGGGVHLADTLPNNSVTLATTPILPDLQDLQAETTARVIDQARQRHQLTSRPAADEMTPWLKHTQWNDALTMTPLTLIEIAEFKRAPDNEESDLRQVTAAFDRIMQRTLATMAETDPDLRLWLHSPKNEAAHQRPFAALQDPESFTRYAAMWKSFLCYVFRTAPTDNADPVVTTGVQYNNRQWQLIHQIRQLFQAQSIAESNALGYLPDHTLTLDSTLLRLCWKLIMQRLDRNQPFLSPMMHWLAVMGVDETANRLRRPQDYTRVLAAMLYINRLLILERALPSPSWVGLTLTTRDQIDDPLTQLQELRRNWLTEASASPTSKILRQLAYGKAIIKSEGAPAVVNWSDDGQTLYYAGIEISMQGLRQCITAVIKDATNTLNTLMLGATPEIQLGQIQDSLTWNAAFNDAGYSFVTAASNALDVGFDYLLKRSVTVAVEQQLVRQSSTGAMEYHEGRCKAYLTQERHFLNQLLVCMHLCGGQPARAPEICSVKVCNTSYSSRNIYVLDGEVIFVTAYDKNLARRDRLEFVIRYLPDAAGQLLVRYLIYVRPFARALPVNLRNDDYLFATPRGPFNGRQATAALRQVTQQHLGIAPTGLGFSDYRHVAIAVARQHLRQGYELGKNVDANSDSESDSEDDIFDRQAGHGSKVAQLRYAIQAGFLGRLQQPQLTAFRNASKAWQALLVTGASSTLTLPASHRRHASRALTPPSVKRQRSMVSIPSASPSTVFLQVDAQIHTAMRHILGADATFGSEEQRGAMQAVFGNVQQLIVIMRTGSGKSMLFYALASVDPERTVLVIVPYVALIDDLLARAGHHRVQACRWTTADPQIAPLTIVSADVAVEPAFLHWATDLVLRQRLRHVFFDECHVALTDTGYRRRLQRLWLIRNLAAPLTCLTATLPPVLEFKLRDLLLLPTATLLRYPTPRDTITYVVQDIAEDGLLDATVACAAAEQERWTNKQRGIIYVNGYAAGHALAKALDCSFYNAAIVNRPEALHRWDQDGACWIVATGALGTGVDLSNIRTVLHSGRPYGMINFLQQSGRGGRHQQPCTSILLDHISTTAPRSSPETQEVYATDAIDETALTLYIQTAQCRRAVIASYIDGQTATCTSYGNVALCDLCRQSNQPVVPAADSLSDGPALVRAQATVQATVADDVRWLLQYYQHRCLYCDGIADEPQLQATSHTYATCPNLTDHNVDLSYNQFRIWRKMVRFAPYSSCFRCGLAQRYCNAAETKRPCSYPDILLPLLFLTHRQDQLVSQLRGQLGYQGTTDVVLGQFLGGLADGLDGQTTRAQVMFNCSAMDVDESFSRDLMIMGEEEFQGPDRVRVRLEQQLAGLSGPQQLSRLTEILVIADSVEESRVMLIHEAWELMRQRQLWFHHPGGDEAALKDALQFEECIAPALARHQVFLQRKLNYAKEIQQRWGVTSPEALLAPSGLSSQPPASPDAILSRNTLGELARFSRMCTEVEEARQLLADAVRVRQSTAGRRKQTTLLPADVKEARRRLTAKPNTPNLEAIRLSTPAATVDDATADHADVSSPGAKTMLEVRLSTTRFQGVKPTDPPSPPPCACPPVFFPLWERSDILPEALLECAWDAAAHHPRHFCQHHLRELCRRLELSSRGPPSDLVDLLERLHHDHDDDLDAFRQVSPEVFRRSHTKPTKSLAESRGSKNKRRLRYGPPLKSPPATLPPSSFYCLCPARFRQNLGLSPPQDQQFSSLVGALHVETAGDVSGLKNLCLTHLLGIYQMLRVPRHVNLIEFSQLILDQADWEEDGEAKQARWVQEVQEVAAKDDEEEASSAEEDAEGDGDGNEEDDDDENEEDDSDGDEKDGEED